MIRLNNKINIILSFVSILIIISSCSNNTVEKQYVEFAPQIKYMVSSYVNEVGKIDLEEQDIYIEFDVEFKILSIRNDFSSLCFTDTTFDYFAKYNNYNIIIYGKNDAFFRHENLFKQIEICQNPDTLPLLTTGFEQWEFTFDENNNLIDIYFPPIRIDKLRKDSVFSKFLE